MKERILKMAKNFSPKDIGRAFPLPYCIPLYHNVSDEALPHLRHIVKVKTSQQFSKDLDLLAKHFQFVTWDEFLSFQRGERKFKKKVCLLTFDDGFREFYEIVLPILESKSVYAINFVNPAFIDNRNLMFRCKSSLLINSINKDSNLFHLLKEKLPSNSVDELKSNILKLKYDEVLLINELAKLSGLDFENYLKVQKPYLDLEQLKIITQKGFGIAAHSWDHPLYENLGLEEQLDNTVRSIDYMSQNNFISTSFAFPFTDFGVKKVFFEELNKQVKLNFTFGTAGIKEDSIVNNLQRIPMETREDAENILRKEIGYYQLKRFVGKNTIERT